jgi:hypothetical protein
MRTFTIAAWRICAVWLLKKYNLTNGASVLWNCCTFHGRCGLLSALKERFLK